jgi:hypothetical protein
MHCACICLLEGYVRLRLIRVTGLFRLRISLLVENIHNTLLQELTRFDTVTLNYDQTFSLEF